MSGAKIYAVYVIHRSIYPSFPEDPKWEEAMYVQFGEIAEEAVSYMEKITETTELEVEAVLLEEHPAEEI